MNGTRFREIRSPLIFGVATLDARDQPRVSPRLGASGSRQLVLQLLDDLQAELDEGSDFGRRMLARWMEGEQREALAVPIRKEID